ncbi:hypothetical protein D3C72_1953870 [compost metagenome]
MRTLRQDRRKQLDGIDLGRTQRLGVRRVAGQLVVVAHQLARHAVHRLAPLAHHAALLRAIQAEGLQLVIDVMGIATAQRLVTACLRGFLQQIPIRLRGRQQWNAQQQITGKLDHQRATPDTGSARLTRASPSVAIMSR